MTQAIPLDLPADSRDLPPTSLIISSRERPRLLRETIQSVLHGSEVPAELVIIDQSQLPNPELASLETGRACQVRYYHLPVRGLSRGKNAGVLRASCDRIAFIDDDMFVEPGWFGTLMRALLVAGPGAVVTGRVLASQEKQGGGFVPSLAVGEAPNHYQGRQPIDVLSGGHMATTRAVLDAVGPFDERLGAGSIFPSAEDNDWGFRLLSAGFKLVYCPEAVVYHRAWRSSRDYFPLRWNYGHGQGGYYAKHLSLSDRYMLQRVARDIGRRARRLPGRILHQPHAALGDAVFVLGMLSGMAQWLLTQPRERELGYVTARN